MIRDVINPTEPFRPTIQLGEYWRPHRSSHSWVPLGMYPEDLRQHMEIAGMSGTGKSTLMVGMIRHMIWHHYGFLFIDPHSQSAQQVIEWVKKSGRKKVFFEPAKRPTYFNPIAVSDPSEIPAVVNALQGVFKKVWPEYSMPQAMWILGNVTRTVLEKNPEGTLLEVRRILADRALQRQYARGVTDPLLALFWQSFLNFSDQKQRDAMGAIVNKLDEFFAHPNIRASLDPPPGVKTLNMRRLMDAGGILVLDLAKGLIGEDNARLLAALVTMKTFQAALSRADIPEEDRVDFFYFGDEFQTYTTRDFAGILSEARKYRLNLILAHQYTAQIDPPVLSAIFGNVKTTVIFRMGAEDAEIMAKQLYRGTREDLEAWNELLLNLPDFNYYVRMSVRGERSRPFLARTVRPGV